MNRNIHFWKGVDELSFNFVDALDGVIRKLISHKDKIFLITTLHTMYYGEVIFFERLPPVLNFKKAQYRVIDMASNLDHLFLVDIQGQVLKIDPIDLNILDTIIFNEEDKYCIHGCKKENVHVRIKSIAVNDYSMLYVTEEGNLWASGNQPQIHINNEQPKEVSFFHNKTVLEATCGYNFHAVTVKQSKQYINEIGLEEILGESCSKCNKNLSSSLSKSLVSLETFQESNEDSTTNDKKTEDTLDDIERKNIFINAETARQFLTRQFVWVSSYASSKEDGSTENCETPSTIIKQNVSSMANLVYEGVKNVGDRVVTLSRHMSGSSDTNDIKANTLCESLRDEQLQSSLNFNLKSEESIWSSSSGSMEQELLQQELNEKIQILTTAGNDILSTEIWTWGDVQYGQLGTGDTIKRSKPITISKLSNKGVKKLLSGDFHVLALMFDGQVFAWGKNNLKQVSLDSNVDQQSSPRLLKPKSIKNDTVKDIAVGDSHSLILMNRNLYFTGQSCQTNEMIKLNIVNPVRIFSSGQYTCCLTSNEIDLSNDLTNEQIFLEQLLTVHQHFIEPLFKKLSTLKDFNIYEQMCQYYIEIMNLTVLNLSHLWNDFNDDKQLDDLPFISNVEEYTTVYKYYWNAICDIISTNGFSHVVKIMKIPQPILDLFQKQIENNEKKKLDNDSIITIIMKQPLIRLTKYQDLILHLMKNASMLDTKKLTYALIKWEQLLKEQEKKQSEAELTQSFWQNFGKPIDGLKSSKRRIIKESRTHNLTILNSGLFSSHWFALFNDIFVHISGSSHIVYSLQTLWAEVLQDSDTLQNAISITVPEDNFVIYTPNASERNEWLHTLQNTIKISLNKISGDKPPVARMSSYRFTKHNVFKDATYTGRWLNGKPHGSGKLEWPDGRTYLGQFHQGIINGIGKMDNPSQGFYVGEWKNGQQAGHGTMKYINGDFYEGNFEAGLPHGHGIKKEGHFMASVASVYMGEWANGLKQGYGVIDDIMTGQKYLGLWNNGMKHGSGLIVTLDGIYYEGIFVNDVFMGRGIMVLEDGTHYEGEFKSIGIFNGKGTLTLPCGNKLEGNLTGAWNEDIKVVATLRIDKSNGISMARVSKPSSFGKLCVSSEEKWKTIFKQCYTKLGISECCMKNNNHETESTMETRKIWQNIASAITNSRQRNSQQQKLNDKSMKDSSREKENSITIYDQLDTIPSFGRDKLTIDNYCQIQKYLTKAFETPDHPLGNLLTKITTVYTTTYGGVRVHPLLLSHAVSELHSITIRIYEIVTLLFPALTTGISIDKSIMKEQVISAASVLHPIILPRVHSSLFILYALHNKKEDDGYWERLFKWNKHPDTTLMVFLDIDSKLWRIDNELHKQSSYFIKAVETLQQLKTTFSPMEKLMVVKNTFEQITKEVEEKLSCPYEWTMDNLIPVFTFVVVRASVLQLGSEIHFIEDFMESYLENGEFGIMFTTLKACYYQILQEQINVGDL